MRVSRIALVVLCLSVWPAKADALTLDRTCLVALMKSSDCVVHGTVEEVRAPDEQERPTILADLRVTRILKGEDVPGNLEIVFTGIVTDQDRVATPPYEVSLTPNEEVVLFLTRLDGNRIKVTNGLLGKFAVSESESGRKTVRSAIGAIPLCSQDPEDRPSQMSLTEFLKRLEKIAAYPQ